MNTRGRIESLLDDYRDAVATAAHCRAAALAVAHGYCEAPSLFREHASLAEDAAHGVREHVVERIMALVTEAVRSHVKQASNSET